MVGKKAAPVKKPSSMKAAPSKKRAAPGKKLVEGDRLFCETCGLGVLVDDAGWVAVREVICCGVPMKPHKISAEAKKPASKAKAAK
jgi:hypothetical protein